MGNIAPRFFPTPENRDRAILLDYGRDTQGPSRPRPLTLIWVLTSMCLSTNQFWNCREKKETRFKKKKSPQHFHSECLNYTVPITRRPGKIGFFYSGL